MALFAQASPNRKITWISSPVGSIIDDLVTTFYGQLTLFLMGFQNEKFPWGASEAPLRKW